MNKKIKALSARLTVHYSGIHACYWGSLAVISGFASVYLLYRGFTNSQIGIMMAAANVLTVFLQPVVSSFADSSRKVSLNQLLTCMLTGMLVLFLMLLYVPDVIMLVAVLYALIRIIASIIVPLVDSLGFRLERRGVSVNYGIARAAGSVSYAILASAIGLAAEHWSEAVLPWFCVVIYGVMLVLVLLFHIPKKAVREGLMEKTSAGEGKAAIIEKTDKPAHIGVIGFFRKYPGFFLILLGFMFIYTTHMTVFGTYYYQVILFKGGDSAVLGTAASLSAILEIPVIAGFAWLGKKIRCSSLLCLSAVFFTIKAFAQWVLPGVGGIYLAGALQMLAYAVSAPAMVYFVNGLMAPEDQVKGQGYAATASTIGSILGSLIGGLILDLADPQLLLAVSTGISALGTVIALVGIRRQEGESNVPNFDC